MAFFSDLQTALDALRAQLGDDVDAVEIPVAVRRLSDEGVVGVIGHASVLVRGAESVRIAASGVVAARSTRDAGHSGLAQTRGHRSPVSLIQDLTGTTRADAARQVRLGEALADGVEGFLADRPGAPGGVDAEAAAGDGEGTGTGAGDGEATGTGAAAGSADPRRGETSRPWHAALGDALMTGALTSAQHDAIFRGLSQPPATDTDPNTDTDADAAAAADAAAVSAWAAAAGQLVEEAPVRTVEELAAAARAVRDLLDPAGATRRFEERFAGRSFRIWTDRDGTHRAHISFDDEMAAWVRAIIDTAMRPRRGGPRFIDPAEAARAQHLAEDARSNDQLTYDLIMDTLRAGALADPATVFGTRQAGIRLVITTDALHDAVQGRPAVGLLEDSDTTIPGWVVAQHTCNTATTPCTLDPTGNPLHLGHEHRLFTPKQRIALAIRDGGCRWTGCDRPASYCEAHHIDPYAEGGRTDIDRGILLCRFHHMNLHHHRWTITRDRHGDFHLHPPRGAPPVPLPTRLPRRYAWGNLRPPPPRFRPTAA